MITYEYFSCYQIRFILVTYLISGSEGQFENSNRTRLYIPVLIRRDGHKNLL